MVYAYQVPPAPRPPRPATVTVASSLLYVAAAALVIGAAAQFGLVDAVRRGYQQDVADPATAGTLSYIVVGVLAVVWLLPAVGLAVLGILNVKGRKAARIVTWVLGGVTLCCCGVETLSGVLGTIGRLGAPQATTSGDTVSATGTNAIAQSVVEHMPGWYQPTLAATSLVVVLTVSVAMILLALPAAHGYFRPPPAQWVLEPVPMPPPVEPPPPVA
jgi:hypothetical protein